MAGIRHHILPRFLLKGFASKTVRQEVSTWVYRKEGGVFETNITKVAVEKHFYGRNEDLNVDNKITDIEKDFAILLDNLRRQENGYEILEKGISEFIGHLSIRTKHLRDSLVETTDLLSGTLFDYLADPNNFRAWFFEYLKRHPEVMRQCVDGALKKMRLPKAQRLILRQKLLAVVSPQLLISQVDKNTNEYTFLVRDLGATFLEKLPSILREQHIKLLAKSLIPEPRVEEYKNLHWFVCKSHKPLIIGDIGCLFEVSGEKRFLSLSGKNDNLHRVYLPIATDRLIVGTHSSEMPEIDFDYINENFIKCSRDFFICGEYLSNIEMLLNQIGVDSEILGKKDVQKILKEAIEES